MIITTEIYGGPGIVLGSLNGNNVNALTIDFLPGNTDTKKAYIVEAASVIATYQGLQALDQSLSGLFLVPAGTNRVQENAAGTNGADLKDRGLKLPCEIESGANQFVTGLNGPIVTSGCVKLMKSVIVPYGYMLRACLLAGNGTPPDITTAPGGFVAQALVRNFSLDSCDYCE